MDLLWKEKRPLCRSEIIALSPDRSWKAGSIHILLNSMLEKGAVQVAGFVQSSTVCGLVLPHAAACMAFPLRRLVDGAVRAAVRHGAGHAHLEAQTGK